MTFRYDAPPMELLRIMVGPFTLQSLRVSVMLLRVESLADGAVDNPSRLMKTYVPNNE